VLDGDFSYSLVVQHSPLEQHMKSAYLFCPGTGYQPHVDSRGNIGCPPVLIRITYIRLLMGILISQTLICHISIKYHMDFYPVKCIMKYKALATNSALIKALSHLPPCGQRGEIDQMVSVCFPTLGQNCRSNHLSFPLENPSFIKTPHTLDQNFCNIPSFAWDKTL